MKNRNEYIKYLFELLVVFMGVTAAFLLSNWAEKKRDQKEEFDYTINLSEEINGHDNQLKENLLFYEEKLEKVDRLIQLLNEKAANDSITILIAEGLFSNHFFEPNSSTWESLKTSGELKLISDLKLKILLTELYSSYESIELMENILKEFIQDDLLKYTLTHINLQDMKFYNNKSTFDPYFINLVVAYRILVNNYYYSLNSTNEICNEANTFIMHTKTSH